MKNYRLIPEYCIGSDGNVKTVLLLSKVPLNQIRSIYLDQHSLTSVKLVKILAKHYWKINPVWIQPDGSSQKSMNSLESIVAIGDKTFMLKKDFSYVYDLSDEWKKFTGLPFVFACWIVRNDSPDEAIVPFTESLKWGLEHKKESIEKLFDPAGFPDIDIHEYLEKNIDFIFDEQKHRALKLFLDYAKKI